MEGPVMQQTAICVPFEHHRQIERLRQIVAVDPRLEMRVFHRRGRSEFDPHYMGWGRIGDPHYYHLLARAEVTREEIWEIAEALAEVLR